MAPMKRVLNVGGNSKAIALPAPYAGWEQVLLDIDPGGAPDIVCDARELHSLPAQQFDAVYCSHNLEHFHRHEVPRVLQGFVHVLRPDGFVHLRVPDLGAVMREVQSRGLDLEDVLYTSDAGPITVLDVLYGYGPEIERSGQPYFAHKTGFTARSLARVVKQAGLRHLFVATASFEVMCLAFLKEPDPPTRQAFGLPAA